VHFEQSPVLRLLRQVDQPPCRRLLAELAAPAGIGLALNDRLRRAAAR